MSGILQKEMNVDMKSIKAYFQRKGIIITFQRYGIDALGAMAQGLFCTLLVGTILNTLGQQFGIAQQSDEIQRQVFRIHHAYQKQ